MSNIYDFDSALKAHLNSASEGIAQSEHSPDDAQRAFDMSKASGVDANFIADNSEDFEKDLQGRLAAGILQQNAPLTAFTNSHPLHPSLIKDDIHNLDDVSKSFEKLPWNPHKEVFSAYGDAIDATLKDEPSAFEAAAQRLSRAVRPEGGRQTAPLSPLNRQVYQWVVGSLGAPTWGTISAVHDLLEKTYSGELHRQLMEGDLTAGTAGQALAVASLGLTGAIPKVTLESLGLAPTAVQEFLNQAYMVSPAPRAAAMGEAMREAERAAGAAQPQLALPSPEMLQEIAAEAGRVKPWADAGEVPLPTISTVADFAAEHQAGIAQENLKSAIDDAAKSNLKERSPEKFEEFLEHHDASTITIDPQVVIAKPDAFPWIPPPTGPGLIQVPASNFLANFDKANWNEVKDFISTGGLPKSLIDELKQTPSAPVPGDNVEQLRNALGLTAWHATTADFRQFSLDFMGTGEGAQVFGPGHYFAEAEGTAQDYLKKFSEHMMSDEERQASRILEANDGDREAALASINGQIEELKGQVGGSKLRSQVLDRVRQVIESGKELPKANLLKVNLDADPNLMLDYDKLATEQSPEVRAIINKLGIKSPEGVLPTVQSFLNAVRDKGASVQARMDEEAQAKRWRQLPSKLSAAGLHGIRYLDQESRFDRSEFEKDLAYWKASDSPQAAERIKELEQLLAKGGTSNFVIFDDNRIKITHKNGEPVSEALRRKVLERTKSGRPLRTQKMRMGPSLDRDILEAGFDRTLPENRPEPFEGGKAMGISQKLYESLLEKVQNVTSGDAKWRQRRAEAQARLERSNEWKAERAKLEPQIRERIESIPEIAAWERLKKLKLDPAHIRPAERAEIPELVGIGGVDPDLIAGEFGYDTGQELVDSMRALAAEAKAGKGDIVDRLVNQRLDLELKAKLGKTPLERLDEEIDHVVGLDTIEMLHEKYVALGAQIGTQIPLSKYAVAWMAKQSLEAKPFMGHSAMSLMRDVVVAAKRVQRALAAGKMQEAFPAFQDQYLLTLEARIMREVEREAKAADRIAKRFRNREVPNFPIEHASFIQQILTNVGYRVNRPPGELGRIIKLGHDNQGWAENIDAFVKRLTDVEGWDAPVAAFLRDGGPKPLAKMNIGDARATFASLKTLVKRGTAENQVEVAGKMLDFMDLRNEAVDMVKHLGPFKHAPLVKKSDERAGIWRSIKSFTWANINAEVFFDRLGEFQRGNPILRAYIDPLIDGFYAKEAALKEVAKEFKALGKIANPKGKVKNDLFRDPDAFASDGTIYYPDMTRTDAYGVLAHMGNNSNMTKLAEGYGILNAQGKADLQKITNWAVREIQAGRLSHADFDWLQGYGRISARVKEQADINALKESDVPADNVPLEGFDILGKHYEGWYHRLTPHEFWEGKPQAADSINLEGPGYTRAATPRRYEKARTEAKYPVSLDFQTAVRLSIDEQLHDIHLRGPVREAAKLFRDETWRRAIRNHGSQELQENLDDWLLGLSNAAARDRPTENAIMSGVRFFRRNIVGNYLNLNPTTVFKHFSTALIRSAIEIGPTSFFTGFFKLWTPGRYFMNKAINMIMTTSKELPGRADFWEHTYTGQVSKAFGKWSLSRLWNKVGRQPVAFSDMLSAKATYYGKFLDTFAETGDVETARREADRMVVYAHGSLNPARRSPVLNNRSWEAFTSFHNFLSTMFQAYYRGLANIKIAKRQAGEHEWEKAFDHFLSGIFPFVLTYFAVGTVDWMAKEVFNRMKPVGEGWVANLKRFAYGVHPLAAPIPVVSQIVDAMENGGESAFGVVASGVNDVLKAFRAGAKAAAEKQKFGKVSAKTKADFTERALGAAGNLTKGVPGRAPARSIANLQRYSNNIAHPKTGWELFWYLMGRNEKPPK